MQATSPAPQDLRTQRLILRQPQRADAANFATMHADARVMKYFPNTLSRSESDRFLERLMQHWAAFGFGPWSVFGVDGVFLGLAGLVNSPPEIPTAPCVEVLWRFRAATWRQGIATEATVAAIDDGFQRLNVAEIVSFATESNVASLALMAALGMARDATSDFTHPNLPVDHALSPHLVCRLRRAKHA